MVAGAQLCRGHHSAWLQAGPLARLSPADHSRPTHRHPAKPQDPSTPGRTWLFYTLKTTPDVPHATGGNLRRLPAISISLFRLARAPRPRSIPHLKTIFSATTRTGATPALYYAQAAWAFIHG